MQAARGTSLSPDDSSLNDTQSVPSRTRVRALLLASFALLYALDQLTKWLAVDRLTGEPDHELVGELLVLRLTRNAGAAFSTGTGYTSLFSCLAIAAVLVVLWLSRRVASPGWAVALGLLLAGITGNLTDRVFRSPGVLRGHVVDFLMLPHWPIFNVADICINVAAALILVQAFRGIRLDGSRVEREAEEPADS
ncbi:signal peptidase II [Nocardioides halotolerans]|jgi:signal peptidase II|uniref:signal peptidase II n=1 Tax=Nocardioides halotolerans TaxID=433660 RepID=UPI00048EB374|nr:signal peptidase II [Nocardioides halotolerans]